MRLTKTVGLISAVALVAGVAACSGDSGDGDAGEMQVMMFPSVAYRLPVMVAQEKGFFDDEGVKINIIAQPNNLQGIQAMEATNTQAGMMSSSTLAQGIQAGSDVKLFCGGIDVAQSSILAPPDSDLPSVEDGATPEEVFKAMSGLKVGSQTPVGAGFQKILEAALTNGGTTDIDWVNVGGSNSVTQASLQNGSVDVAQTSPSGTQILTETGAAKLLMYLPDTTGLYRDSYGSGWVGPTKWLEENPQTAKAFCDATAVGLEYILNPENKDEVLPILMKDSGIDDIAIAEAVLETYKQGYSAELDEKVLDSTFDTFRELGIIEAEPPITAAGVVDKVGR
ncbi:ABC transporter substrate-binding protein [Dietzia aurantiaca]|uniref:ABC transporter substrate-binding protein n=1 Tax=Dietzia aurantiaca TaxID=983873 RepID=A0ABV9PNU3_9ACTN